MSRSAQNFKENRIKNVQRYYPTRPLLDDTLWLIKRVTPMIIINVSFKDTIHIKHFVYDILKC